MTSREQVPALQTFKLLKVLGEDSHQKTVAFLGTFAGRVEQAVVLLARQHFQGSKVQSLLEKTSNLETHFRNDVYSKHTACIFQEDGAINVDIIYPATEKHISKYTSQRYHMVQETAEQYEAITKAYIEGLPGSRLQWVHNILDGKAESERVLFSDRDLDKGFLLLPDQKWDQTDVQGLYLQAMVYRRDLRSMRDLRAAHLPLLRHIRDQSQQVVSERYAIQASELRLWVHYQPSYYHLHVHIAHIQYSGSGLHAGKAILLDDIIDNLEQIDGSYYERRTLAFTVGEQDPLFGLLQPHGQKRKGMG